jgi:YD repeat-containing protein
MWLYAVGLRRNWRSPRISPWFRHLVRAAHSVWYPSIGSTGGVSGTVLVTNTYDLADELTTSLNKVGSNPAQTTTYTYDGNGNQIIASGPTSAAVSTYNQQNQLIQVQGPNTDLQLVYDGQGDRPRSYEQMVPTPVIMNDVQDLVCGRS